MQIELTDEQIRNAFCSIVEEELPDAVRVAVRTHADHIIKEAVRERIKPVVDGMLASEQFVSGRWDDQKTPLDIMIKRAVSAYLDERVYLYSKTDDRPSVRFTRSSSQHGSDGPTRLEAFLRFTIEQFCDAHLANKLEATAKAFLDERGGIEVVAREQMAQLLKEKFKL